MKGKEKTMKKILLFVLCILLLSGCGDKKFNEYYENMSISSKNITGYKLDLRIYGSNKTTVINKIVRVDNYMNTDYELTYVNNIKNTYNLLKSKELFNLDNLETTYFVVDNKLYENNDKEEKVLSTKKISSLHYRNPNTYLEGLKHVKKTSKTSDITIATNNYKVYDVTINKDFFVILEKDIDIKLNNEKDITAKIYVDSKDKIYRIIYETDEITINACYYGINTAKEINITK